MNTAQFLQTGQSEVPAHTDDLFRARFVRIQNAYENKIKELSILKELGNTLRSTNFYDREAFFEDQLQIIRKYTALEDIALLLVDEGLQVLETVAGTLDSRAQPGPSVIGTDQGPYGRTLKEVKTVLLDGEGVEVDDPGALGRVSVVLVPVVHNDRAIGILRLHSESTGFDQNQVRFFSLVADQLATAVILLRVYHQMLREERNRLLLSRFFSCTVTEKIFCSGENLRLGGERKNVTILFADLRGFTAMSEYLDQEKVVEILNAYFSLMTPIIFKHDGTLDKLMGDGIMAFFGAPLSHDDDPTRAVRSAVEMISALQTFNPEARAKGWPELSVSIGINAGEVVAGYIGSEEHLNYTVIGDAVNVAQRLQSIAGSDEILISRTVLDQINTDLLIEQGAIRGVLPLSAQKVKGKKRAIEIFRLEL
ncbi:MAG: GAF domain-containing protein [Deltaproteobacteria bacterium]|nr:GAF domain-containing protein [Deltaproteobacteria bacterium]